MRKSYTYLSIGLLLTAILIAYHQLGGFKEPEITLVEVRQYRVLGSYYEGRLSNVRWEDLFVTTRDLLGEGKVKGDLTIIWYNEPEEEQGFAKAFIGIRVDDTGFADPQLELREIKMNGLIRAELEAHNLVMPRPQKVIQAIRKYAREQHISLQDIVIERYPEESLIVTEIPIR